MHQPDIRVPVTLLTGFLGAGKTTLLGQLLRDAAAGRVAVVMNELGEVGLDHDLIEEATDGTVLMASGCLCCSIRGDLSRTLTSLMARRLRGTLGFDRVVIETTGIAEPGPILQGLLLDEIVARHYRLDGVVTVADAAHGMRTLDAQEEAAAQIAMADRIVLSKTDLVAPSDLRRFEARIGGLNPTARRLRANHGRVPGGAVFGLSALRPDAGTGDIAGWLGTEPWAAPLAGLSGLAAPVRTVSGGATAPRRHARIGTASITVGTPIPARLFARWIETCRALTGPDVLRIKGLAHVEGSDTPRVFHGVQHVFDPPVPLRGWSGPDRTSRIVVVARDIERHGIAARLAGLLPDAAVILPRPEDLDPPG